MKFIFDLDGTLCFDRKTISEEIKQALGTAHRYGHEVAFASARSFRDCLDVLGPELSQNLVIGLNGGVAYQEGRLCFEEILEDKAYQTTLDWLLTYHVPFFVDNAFDYGGEMIYKMPFYASVDPLKKAQHLPIKELKNPIKLVAFMGNHEELVAETLERLSSFLSLDVSYHEHEKCLYVNPAQTNKATTSVALCGDAFVAFGNDQNDIDFFKASLYAVQIGEFPALLPFSDDVVSLKGDLSAAVAAKIVQVFADFRGK